MSFKAFVYSFLLKSVIEISRWADVVSGVGGWSEKCRSCGIKSYEHRDQRSGS